jgi:exonuclease 3'-5' domain-containing protein 1
MGKKAKLLCQSCSVEFKKTSATTTTSGGGGLLLCKACSRSNPETLSVFKTTSTKNNSSGGAMMLSSSGDAMNSNNELMKRRGDIVANTNALSTGRFAALASLGSDDANPLRSNTAAGASGNNAGKKKKKKKKKGSGGNGGGGGEQNANKAALSDRECREIFEELDEQVVFIDSHTSEAFKQCVIELKQSKVIAYDCEGVRLSRTGKITLLQIAVPKKIFLIDVMTAGGKEVFIDGGLKDVIQSEEILKLAYDVRMDSDALFHQHDVLIKNVLDLQLLDIAIRRASGNMVEHLPSLSKTVSRRLTNAEVLVCEDLKKRVKNMYTSIEDGDLWARRPLSDDARRYAALDAWVLMKLDQAMRPNGTTASHLFPGFDESWNKRVLDASRKRIDEYREKEVPIEQGGKRTPEMTHAPMF